MALFSFRRVLQKQQELMEYDKIQDETLKKLGLTRAELKDMSAQFRGSIYVPGDPGYKNARKKAIPSTPPYPLIICYPRTTPRSRSAFSGPGTTPSGGWPSGRAPTARRATRTTAAW
jgi:hypothetical protein